jgi:sulfur carrier protein
MRITVNFQDEVYEEPTLSVRDLIQKKRWSFPLIITRINGLLVERSDYETRLIADGDTVELYHLVSGG